MKLPIEFTQRMEQMLGPEFEAFMDSYNLPRNYGLRVNTLKLSVEDFKKISPFELEPVDWAPEGFYVQEDARPAKHPYYHAGLYYIQEPSAMITVSVLDPKPGDKVLDLCAAPGGKSTQIAARLAGQGLLVSNDVSNQRIRALVRNLELFGVRNHIVLNETPANIAKRFPCYFDKIAIDAPCSGEGMFRKDPFAVKSWDNYSVEKCTNMQRSILKTISGMLKPGGHVVYSTCTFNADENEAMMAYLLAKSPELELVEIKKIPGMRDALPQLAGGNPELSKAARLWPHLIRGEGHFVALLRKKDGEEKTIFQGQLPIPDKASIEDYRNFISDAVTADPEPQGQLAHFNSRLYMVPDDLPDLSGIKVVRPGWYLGELKKNRFKPSTPMALGLSKKDAVRVLDFDKDSVEVIKYLKGETLNILGEWGWTLVCVDGYPLGWAKQLKDMLNNYYPAGWRWLD